MAMRQLQGLIQNAPQPLLLAQWYEQHLGFVISQQDHLSGSWLEQLFGPEASAGIDRVVLQLGAEQLQIWGWRGVAAPVAYPSAWGGNDHWFQHICLVSADVRALCSSLDGSGVELISSEPQQLPSWNTAAAGIWSVKLKDPLGHPLELLQFPADKGDRRWHGTAFEPVLPQGMDHSAISIASTELSLSFYQGLLGFAVMGGSLNHGPEQDHLDGLQGTRVEITALAPAPHHMGLEFLHYAQPVGGRAREKARWSDACDRKLLLQVDGITALHQRLLASPFAQDCSALVTLPQPLFGASGVFVVRDPDSHTLLVVGEG